MKNIFVISILTCLILLYSRGWYNYTKTFECVAESEQTDADICNCNKKHGYTSLDWYEEPTNTEIILSNFN